METTHDLKDDQQLEDNLISGNPDNVKEDIESNQYLVVTAKDNPKVRIDIDEETELKMLKEFNEAKLDKVSNLSLNPRLSKLSKVPAFIIFF